MSQNLKWSKDEGGIDYTNEADEKRDNWIQHTGPTRQAECDQGDW